MGQRVAKGMLLNVIILSVLILLSPLTRAPSNALASDSNGHVGWETLREIENVAVWVAVSQDFEHNGLNSRQIKNDVEIRLRRVGIKVVESSDFSPRSAMLAITVGGGGTDDRSVNMYAVSISVDLIQSIQVLHNGAMAPGKTWSSGGKTGFIGGAKLNRIRDYIGDEVDEFINAYLAMNPK